MAFRVVTFAYFCLGISATGKHYRPAGSSRSVDEHAAWRFLDEECGDSFADRIIGGVEATLGQFPWIARLGYEDEYSGEVEYKCGAALLNPWYLLTAAHCVTNLDPADKLVTVRLGEHDDATERDCRAGVCALPVQDRRVAATAHHPSFNKPPYSNDIAIVELQQPAVITEFVSPICLPRGEHLRSAREGEMVTIAGWGVTNITTDEVAGVLQTLQVPVLPRSRCGAIGRMVLVITEAQICAGAEVSKDACAGDSGGPLMQVYDSDSGPRTHLLGVVSFGPSLCGFEKPGVYTSVPHYMLWILDHIQH